MNDHEPRLFACDEAVRRLGEAMLARTLPKAEWTHEAHLATCLWLLLERPDILPPERPDGVGVRIIFELGGVILEMKGSHERITQFYIRRPPQFLARTDAALPLAEKVNALLQAPEGQRDWPLRSYSPERLFSKEARLGWVEPDLAALW